LASRILEFPTSSRKDPHMPTLAQLAANRANAQNSTGPRSAEGKDASRFNALKHGMDAASIIIPGEDPAAWQQLAVDYNHQFHPQSALEEFHVDTLIRCDWQKRRLQRTEAKIYRALLAEGPTPEDLDVAILRDSPTAKLLHRVIAQIASLDRAFCRTLNDLRRIQRDRAQETEAAALPADPPRLRTEFPSPAPIGNEPNPTPEINPALRL
jgi:hypothetical protein